MSAHKYSFFIRCLLKEKGVDRIKVIAACRDQQNNPQSWGNFVQMLNETIDISTLNRLAKVVNEKYPRPASSPPTMPIVLEPRSKPTKPYPVVVEAPSRKRRRTMADAFNEGKAVGYKEMEALIKKAYLDGKLTGIQEGKKQMLDARKTTLKTMRVKILKMILDIHPDKSDKVLNRHDMTAKMTDFLSFVDIFIME
jgi:hypothetical protein